MNPIHLRNACSKESDVSDEQENDKSKEEKEEEIYPVFGDLNGLNEDEERLSSAPSEKPGPANNDSSSGCTADVEEYLSYDLSYNESYDATFFYTKKNPEDDAHNFAHSDQSDNNYHRIPITVTDYCSSTNDLLVLENSSKIVSSISDGYKVIGTEHDVYSGQNDYAVQDTTYSDLNGSSHINNHIVVESPDLDSSSSEKSYEEHSDQDFTYDDDPKNFPDSDNLENIPLKAHHTSNNYEASNYDQAEDDDVYLDYCLSPNNFQTPGDPLVLVEYPSPESRFAPLDYQQAQENLVYADHHAAQNDFLRPDDHLVPVEYFPLEHYPAPHDNAASDYQDNYIYSTQNDFQAPEEHLVLETSPSPKDHDAPCQYQARNYHQAQDDIVYLDRHSAETHTPPEALVVLNDDNHIAQDNYFHAEDYSQQYEYKYPPTKASKPALPEGFAPFVRGESLCLICGDYAIGYKFGVFSCDSCRAFYKRSNDKGETLQCRRNNNCLISHQFRRHCNYCRLKKCQDVGMTPDGYCGTSIRSNPQTREERNRKKKEADVALTRFLEAHGLTHLLDMKPERNVELTEKLVQTHLGFCGHTILKSREWPRAPTRQTQRFHPVGEFAEAWETYSKEIEKDLIATLPFISVLLQEFNSSDKWILMKKHSFAVHIIKSARGFNKFGMWLSGGRLLEEKYLKNLYKELFDEINRIAQVIRDLPIIDEDIAMFIAVFLLQPLPVDCEISRGFKKSFDLAVAYDTYMQLLFMKMKGRSTGLISFATLLNIIPQLNKLNQKFFEMLNGLRCNLALYKYSPLFSEIYTIKFSSSSPDFDDDTKAIIPEALAIVSNYFPIN